MTHEDKQAVTFIARATRAFRRFRVAARSTRFECVQNHTAETPIVIVKCGPPKQTVLKSIPVMNQFLSARLKLHSDLCGRALAFDHHLKVSEQVSPAELMTMVVQMAVGRVAITANEPPNSAPSSSVTTLRERVRRIENNVLARPTTVQSQAFRPFSRQPVSSIFTTADWRSRQ